MMATKRSGITRHTVHLTPSAAPRTVFAARSSLLTPIGLPLPIQSRQNNQRLSLLVPILQRHFGRRDTSIMGDSAPRQYVPLTCHGHSRPVPHLSFSPLEKEDVYYMISACKGLLATNSFPFLIRPLMEYRSRWQPYASRWSDGRLDRHLPRPQGRCVASEAKPQCFDCCDGFCRLHGKGLGHEERRVAVYSPARPHSPRHCVSFRQLGNACDRRL